MRLKDTHEVSAMLSVTVSFNVDKVGSDSIEMVRTYTKLSSFNVPVEYACS